MLTLIKINTFVFSWNPVGIGCHSFIRSPRPSGCGDTVLHASTHTLAAAVNLTHMGFKVVMSHTQ